jgi:5-methylcytosine-specific restriction endonuclease McrA
VGPSLDEQRRPEPRRFAGRAGTLARLVVEPDDLTRLAMFEAWGRKCVWCGRPLFFNEMEIEHLLPRSLKGEERARILALHGRDLDFDLERLENLAPSCRPCNRGKGAKPPPDKPIVAVLLGQAEESAPAIRDEANRFRDNRRIQRALPIVLSAVKAGDEAAIAAIRVATDELSAGVHEASGRVIGHLHSSLVDRRRVVDLMTKSDPHFHYSGAIHAADAPAPGVTPGTILSLAETVDGITSRVDVVPLDESAMETYGPQFRLAPTRDEAGRKASELLTRALQRREPVTISEGLQLLSEQVPPALAPWLNEPVSGTFQLGAPTPPRDRPIPDWDAAIRASKQRDADAIRILLRAQKSPPAGWDASLVGQFGGLTVEALFRTQHPGGQMRWNFRHVLDDSPARDQLAVLELLDALTDAGEMVVVDRGRSARPDMRVDVPPSTFSERDEVLLALLRDVCSIENWAGVELPLADQIDGEEVAHIAVLAHAIRNGGRLVTWQAISMDITSDEGVERLRAGGHLRIEHQLSTTIFGRTIELGTSQMDVAGFHVRSVAPIVGQPGSSTVTIEPADAEAAEIFERLIPPKRKTRRPPPPPRRKARQARRRRRK